MVMGTLWMLFAVPAIWILLVLVGAGWSSTRSKHVGARDAALGAAVIVIVTYVAVVWLDMPGWTAIVLIALGAVIGLMRAAGEGIRWRDRRVDQWEIGLLIAVTALAAAFWLPISEWGLQAIGTGNHADMPGYLMNAGYLFLHGISDAPHAVPVDIAGWIQGDVFGAYALLSPTFLLPGIPTAGVLPLITVSSVVVVQLVHSVMRRILGQRFVLVAAGGALLAALSWPVTFNAFAYFLSQAWGIALSLALLVWATESVNGVSSPWFGVFLVIATLLVSPPIGLLAASAAVGILIVHCLFTRTRLSAIKGMLAIVFGSLPFIGVWIHAIERTAILGGTPAGWPMPEPPLWAVLGFPFPQDREFLLLVARPLSLLLLLASAAGWILSRRGRRLAARLFPVGFFALLWVLAALKDPGSYVQWKAFSYAQPTLLIFVWCGLAWLLAGARGERLIGSSGRSLAYGVVGFVLVSACVFAWSPRAFFDRGGCCISSSVALSSLYDGAAVHQGQTIVEEPNLWPGRVAIGLLAPHRPVVPAGISPPARPESTLRFDRGAAPSLADGSYLWERP